jgi:hypothetical protein
MFENVYMMMMMMMMMMMSVAMIYTDNPSVNAYKYSYYSARKVTRNQNFNEQNNPKNLKSS